MRLDSQRAVSRKQFFRLGLAALADKIAQLSPLAMLKDACPDSSAKPVLRPPGAIAETAFLQKCTRCEACVKACPHWAIGMAREEYGDAMGTPIIDPRQSPCYWCRDFPCIEACKEGALIFDESTLPMGRARIIRDSCLAWQGHRCQSCVTNCPIGRRAIGWNFRGQPEINSQNCTGCGVCLYVCPAEPPAIDIQPAQKSAGTLQPNA